MLIIYCKNYPGLKTFLFQIETEQGFHSWFGFTLIIKNFNQINRNEICSFLEKNKIETQLLSLNFYKTASYERYEI